MYTVQGTLYWLIEGVLYMCVPCYPQLENQLTLIYKCYRIIVIIIAIKIGNTLV